MLILQDVVGGKALTKRKSSGTRERPLTDKWASVMQFIGRQGQASYDDIMRFASQEGHSITNNALRGQMSIYSNEKQWVERVSDGVFKLTEAGAEKCGYKGNKEGSSAQTQEPS